LYAEDDSMTVMEVQEKLENNGYEVIVAYDGNEALEKFIACKPDLIVLDVDMPGKDGLEVLQFIRLQDSQTPVIIYSCLIDEEKQIKGLEWGANVYLLKNYSPTLLLAQIQRCIARSGEEVIRLSKQVEYDFSACNLSYLPDEAQLVAGDEVLTSGNGDVYPAGLVVGQVESVFTDASGLTRYAIVTPEVKLDQLVEVFIIKEFDIVE